MFINYARPYLFPLFTILLLVVTSEERCLVNPSFCNKKFRKNDFNRGKTHESMFTEMKRTTSSVRNDKSVSSVASRKQRITSAVNTTSTNDFRRPKTNLTSNTIDSASTGNINKLAGEKDGILQKTNMSHSGIKATVNMKQDFVKNRRPYHSTKRNDKTIKRKRHHNIILRRQNHRSHSPDNLSGRHVVKMSNKHITKSSIVLKIKDNKAILLKRKYDMLMKEIQNVSTPNNGDLNIKHKKKSTRYHFQIRNKKTRDLKVFNTTSGFNDFRRVANHFTRRTWYLNPLRNLRFLPNNNNEKDLKESTNIQIHANFESPKKMIYFTPSTFQFAPDNNQPNGDTKLIKGYTDLEYQNVNQNDANPLSPDILQHQVFSKTGIEQEYGKINNKVFPINPNEISVLKYAPTADITNGNKYPNFNIKPPNENPFFVSPTILSEIGKYMTSDEQDRNKKRINTFQMVSNFQNNQLIMGKKLKNSNKNVQPLLMSKQKETDAKRISRTSKVLDKLNQQRTNIGENIFKELINQDKEPNDLKSQTSVHRLPRQGLKGFTFIHHTDTQNISLSRKGDVDGINLDKIRMLLLTLKKVLDESKVKAGTRLYETEIATEYSLGKNYSERPEAYDKTFHVYLEPVFKAALPGKLTLVEDVNHVTSSLFSNEQSSIIDVKDNTTVTSPETGTVLKGLIAFSGLALISFLTVAIYLAALKHKYMQNPRIAICSMLQKNKEHSWPFNENSTLFENQKCEQEIYDRMIEDNRNLKRHLTSVLGDLQFMPQEYEERRYSLRQHQKKLSDAMTGIIK